jgi:hypothetical protein
MATARVSVTSVARLGAGGLGSCSAPQRPGARRAAPDDDLDLSEAVTALRLRRLSR